MTADFFTLDTLVRLVIKLGPKAMAIIRNETDATSQLLAKLDDINNKLDRMALRGIHSAFDIISQLDDVSSPAMLERLLNSAERNLVEFISLDLKAATGGKANSHWVSRAFFGLSAIATRRNEGTDAARWILKAFISDPRETRTILAPDVYQELLFPQMADLFEQHAELLKGLPVANQRRDEIEAELNKWRTASRVSNGLEWAAALPTSGASVIYGAAARLAWWLARGQALNMELSALPALEKLEKSLEDAIDSRCVELAKSQFSASL